MAKKQLPVNLDDLTHALTWQDDMISTEFYLNRETGEVVTIFEDDLGDDADDEFSEQAQEVEEHPERFIHIETIESHESFRVMEAFLDEVKDEVVRKRLVRALSERKPFRTFKFVLEEYPQIRQAWFDFKDRHELEAAREFLAAHDIETTWQRPAPEPREDKPPVPKKRK